MVDELGCKIPEILDDFESAERLLAKNRTGPFFVSKETDQMFILTAHLKGYTRQHIKTDIDKDARTIVISGEKPFKHILMVGIKVYKEEIEMRGFRKAFEIPEGVILDKIYSTFSEYESTLTISLPKKVHGLTGVGIKELKDEEIDTKTLEHEDSSQGIDKIQEKLSGKIDGNEVKGVKINLDSNLTEKSHAFGENWPMDVHDQAKWHENGRVELVCIEKPTDGAETREHQESLHEKRKGIVKKEFHDQSTQTDPPKRPKKCCAPMIAGSALLVSLMVFVIHMVRNNSKPSKKKQ